MKKLLFTLLVCFGIILGILSATAVQTFAACGGGGWGSGPPGEGYCSGSFLGQYCAAVSVPYWSCNSVTCLRVDVNAGMYSYCSTSGGVCTETIMNQYAPTYTSSGCYTIDEEGPPPTNAPTPIPPTPTPIPPDFVVSELNARNSDGDEESYFKVGQRVYPRVVVRNQGAYNARRDYYTRVYWDEDNTSAYTTLTMGLPFNAGTSRTFEPWTDGTNANLFTSPKTAVLTEAGRQYLLARVNQGNAGPETSYANNERRTGFNVRALLEGYVCNDKNENGQCKNTGDRSKQNITLSLDQNVTDAAGFETHIKSVASAVNGIVDFDYRMDGHYRMSLADVDANENWRIIGARLNNGSWTDSTTCVLNVGPNFECELAAVPVHTLEGTIYIDTNRNGTKDVDEDAGLNNVAVEVDGPTDKNTTTNSSGFYRFRGLRAGSYTLSITVPTGYVAFPSNSITVSPAMSVGLDNPTTFTENIGINEICSLSGRVYVDSDKSGTYDAANDFPIAGRRVFTTGQVELETTTGSDGRYTIPNLTPGNYFVDVSEPDGYINLDTVPRQLTVSDCDNVPGQNFKLFGAYTISGNVFLDTNGDKIKASNGAELNIAANPNVSIQDLAGRPKAYRVNNNNGTYTMENLINASYTVRYGGLPNGYFMVHPVNTTPPSFSATVGSGCAAGTPSPGGACSGQSLEDLDFAVDVGRSWIQTYGLDMRFDHGISNLVPSTPDAACGGANTLVNGSGTTPGIAFSGSLTANFHQGSASTTNWVVGSTNYSETFKAHNSAGTETSYDYFQSVMRQSNITPINLTTVCPDLGSCTLPANLTNGVYQANGDVTLTGTSTLPASRDYVILINGTLTIAGTVDVPNTSTATFSVADDITVAPTIGRVAACPAPANAEIDGFFSTDKSFVVASNSDCSIDVPDLQLNMQGSVAVNAKRENNGRFQNNRTLCDAGNLNFPSFTIKDRPDMILNAPEFLRVPTYIWQEVAPN